MPYTVLIIDDEPWVRNLLTKLVPWETLGFRVVAQAGDGQEGIDACFKHRVDLVLTDIRMPGRDGLNFMRDVRVLYPHISIVVISGHAEFNFAREAIRQGAVDYLVKPVDEIALAETVRKIKCTLDSSRATYRERRELEKSVRRLQTALGATPPTNQMCPGEDPKDLHPIIRRAVELIMENLSQRATLSRLAEELAVNPTYFSELFKREIGVGFQEFSAEVRFEKGKTLVVDTDLKIKDIAMGLGYEDADYFARIFKQRSGMTPLEFRASPPATEGQDTP